MKVGIITFHSAHNYGAMLQAYGLQEFLKSIGHETYMIDYRPDYITKCYLKDNNRDWISKNPYLCIKRLWNYIRLRNIRHRRWDAFNQFVEQRFNLYHYISGDDFHEFDAVFIGSDQIWSANHTGGHYDNIMFGSDFKCKAISYAPSCSQLSLAEEQKKYLAEHLDGMTAISVREQDFKNILQPLTHKNISVVVDPSLLAGKEVFDKIASSINRSRPYVLIYEIAQHENVYRIAQEIAQQLDADIIELTNGMLNFHRKTMHEDASPEDFLGYIKHAACVVTTSFHGTAFSLLYRVPFYMVKQGSAADIRMEFLLKKFGLEKRIVEMNDAPIFSRPNFQVFDIKSKDAISSSKEFVINSLIK